MTSIVQRAHIFEVMYPYAAVVLYRGARSVDRKAAKPTTTTSLGADIVNVCKLLVDSLANAKFIFERRKASIATTAMRLNTYESLQQPYQQNAVLSCECIPRDFSECPLFLTGRPL